MAPLMQKLQENLQRLRQRMAAAAARGGRPPEAVTLVAVTKTVQAATAQALADLGVSDLAENRVPELLAKAAAVHGAGLRWHMVGHLQRNKVRRVLPVVALIHSVDSLRLAHQIDRVAGELGLTARVLLEVNTSGEASKFGFTPAEVLAARSELARLSHLHIEGLMTMAPLNPEPEAARPHFRALRELADRLRDGQGPNMDFRELSMGMTNDFEVAIEEGATFVRIGTALFAGVEDTTS